MRHIPNILTVLRLLATGPVVWLILTRDFRTAFWLSFAVAVTDSLDGWIARRFHFESRFGALVDPVADKLLVGGGFLAMLAVGAVPLWLAAMILGRDLLILAAAAVLHRRTGRRDFPPSRLGKANTFLLLVTGAAVLLDFYPPVFFAVSAVSLIASTLRYAQLGLRYSQPFDAPKAGS